MAEISVEDAIRFGEEWQLECSRYLDYLRSETAHGSPYHIALSAGIAAMRDLPHHHGYWERYCGCYLKCSVCGIGISRPHINYCGNCGAKMDAQPPKGYGKDAPEITPKQFEAIWNDDTGEDDGV